MIISIHKLTLLQFGPFKRTISKEMKSQNLPMPSQCQQKNNQRVLPEIQI